VSKSRAEIRARRKRNQAAAKIGVLLRGQRSDETPSQYLTLSECSDLKKKGVGEFINRGRTFRRFDIAAIIDDDKTIYQSSGNRGASLKIGEAMMDRFVSGVFSGRDDVLARIAVESYA
jgi:hypothetical protein